MLTDVATVGWPVIIVEAVEIGIPDGPVVWGAWVRLSRAPGHCTLRHIRSVWHEHVVAAPTPLALDDRVGRAQPVVVTCWVHLLSCTWTYFNSTLYSLLSTLYSLLASSSLFTLHSTNSSCYTAGYTALALLDSYESIAMSHSKYRESFGRWGSL